LNKYSFFHEIKTSLFGGAFKQTQVDGLTHILDTWQTDFKTLPLTDLAYCLATVYHETAKTMQPIEEYGKGSKRKYGIPDRVTKKVYYGRGFVQLTWKRNYELASKKLSVDLVNKPELALDLSIASKILFMGMRDGWFTGKALKDYCHLNPPDYYNARRIINGTDKAGLISNYATIFLNALKKSI